MALEVGVPAPAFSPPAAPGEIFDVGGRFGTRPVVLLFFPLAFSSVCTAELCAVRDDWSGWESLDVEIYAISVDSPFVTARFRREHGLPFPDFNREVAAAYGVLYEEFYGLRGVAKRAAFAIGLDRRIAYAWASDDAERQPDFAAVRAAVEAARD